MMYELRLKEIRRKAYKRLKDGLGTEKNRVVRAILKEARVLLAEVEKMQANYDYAYDFITEAEFALSDILWVNELNEVVIEAPAAAETAEAEDLTIEANFRSEERKINDEIAEKFEDAAIIEGINEGIEELNEAFLKLVSEKIPYKKFSAEKGAIIKRLVYSSGADRLALDLKFEELKRFNQRQLKRIQRNLIRNESILRKIVLGQAIRSKAEFKLDICESIKLVIKEYTSKLNEVELFMY